MATSASVALDGAFEYAPVDKVDFDSIDKESWLEGKIHKGETPEDEGLENDPPDDADSEQDPEADSESDEGNQDDPDAGEAEDEQTDELPSDEPAEPEVLLAGEFRSAPELESSYLELKHHFGEQSRALDAQREMTQRLQLQAAKVAAPSAPIRFDQLPEDKQREVARLAIEQGYEDPQQLLRDHWRDQVRDAKAHNEAVDRAAQEHAAKFDSALQDLSAYVNQEKHKPYASAIEREWASNPVLFEALQMMPPAQMLDAAKHFTDLVVRAAAAEERQKVFDQEALRARQDGREEHRRTKQTKIGGTTEASRPNTVTVTKPKPRPEQSTSSSRVRSKLAELDDYALQDRIG